MPFSVSFISVDITVDVTLFEKEQKSKFEALHDAETWVKRPCPFLPLATSVATGCCGETPLQQGLAISDAASFAC